MSSPTIFPDALRTLLTPTLLSSASCLELRKGEALFLKRQRPRLMHFVLRGEIVLERISEAGDPVSLQRVRQGFVAEASMQSASYHCNAVVTSPARVVAVPIDLLKAELATGSAFSLRWIGMLNAEVRRLRAQCERMSLKGVDERLLHLIETEGANGQLRVASGLKSLAAELAVSHEAHYREVAALEKSGVIVRGPERLSVTPR